MDSPRPARLVRERTAPGSLATSSALLLFRPSQKPISHPAHSQQMPRVRRIVLDIAPQSHYEIVDGPRVGIFMQSPHFFQYLLSRNNAAIIAYQMPQKFRLHQRQMNRASPGAQFERSEVDRLSVKRKCSKVFAFGAIAPGLARCRRLSSTLPLTAPQQPLQACQQNRELKRLRQVIIRPGGKTLQHIFGTSARCEHEHRDVIPRCAQLRYHAESVLPRQHDVEYDGVKRFFPVEETAGSRFPIPDHLRHIPFGLAIEAQPLRQMRFIFHYQNAAHAAHLGNSSTIVVPCPSPSLSANTLPPCFCAIAFTINNPNPVPFICASER